MIESIISELASTATHLTGLLKNLSEEDSSRRKSPASWSVLECLEHIIITEIGVTRVLMQTAQDAQIISSDKELIGKEKIETALSDRTKKYTAPVSAAPRGRYKSLAEAIEAFQLHRNNLMEMLRNGRIQFDDVTRAHPLLGEMTKTDWLHFLTEHCKRHEQQIIEILQTKNV